MKNKQKLLLALLISVFFASFLSFSNGSTKKSDPWKKWLDEVHLIITKAEESVFYSLKTEEDKKRFQEQFWEARNPKPETPYNEYRMEFYRRLNYAETQLTFSPKAIKQNGGTPAGGVCVDSFPFPLL